MKIVFFRTFLRIAFAFKCQFIVRLYSNMVFIILMLSVPNLEDFMVSSLYNILYFFLKRRFKQFVLIFPSFLTSKPGPSNFGVFLEKPTFPKGQYARMSLRSMKFVLRLQLPSVPNIGLTLELMYPNARILLSLKRELAIAAWRPRQGSCPASVASLNGGKVRSVMS